MTKEHKNVIRINEASFQTGNTTIKSRKNGRNLDGTLKGGYIVGNQTIDLTISTVPENKIMTETFIDNRGFPSIRIRTKKI
tara:strand:+ start:78 stop:320 length:243 start_codon:yes stop_codon:yes gene_type:complete